MAGSVPKYSSSKWGGYGAGAPMSRGKNVLANMQGARKGSGQPLAGKRMQGSAGQKLQGKQQIQNVRTTLSANMAKRAAMAKKNGSGATGPSTLSANMAKRATGPSSKTYTLHRNPNARPAGSTKNNAVFANQGVKQKRPSGSGSGLTPFMKSPTMNRKAR